MTTAEAVVLGAMIAWTPSLVMLAWLLCRSPEADDRNALPRSIDQIRQ